MRSEAEFCIFADSASMQGRRPKQEDLKQNWRKCGVQRCYKTTNSAGPCWPFTRIDMWRFPTSPRRQRRRELNWRSCRTIRASPTIWMDHIIISCFKFLLYMYNRDAFGKIMRSQVLFASVFQLITAFFSALVCKGLAALLLMFHFLFTSLLVPCLAGNFWPRFGGRREVTSLDGEWLFGFNGSKGFDVLRKDHTWKMSVFTIDWQVRKIKKLWLYLNKHLLEVVFVPLGRKYEPLPFIHHTSIVTYSNPRHINRGQHDNLGDRISTPARPAWHHTELWCPPVLMLLLLESWDVAAWRCTEGTSSRRAVQDFSSWDALSTAEFLWMEKKWETIGPVVLCLGGWTWTHQRFRKSPENSLFWWTTASTEPQHHFTLVVTSGIMAAWCEVSCCTTCRRSLMNPGFGARMCFRKPANIEQLIPVARCPILNRVARCPFNSVSLRFNLFIFYRSWSDASYRLRSTSMSLWPLPSVGPFLVPLPLMTSPTNTSTTSRPKMGNLASKRLGFGPVDSVRCFLSTCRRLDALFL